MKYKYNGQWNEMSVKVADTLPIGAVIEYAGSKAPTNWLFVGTEVKITDYPELYDVIGNTFNDENTPEGYFKVYNKKGLVTVGIDSTDTDFDTIGKTGGEKKHKLTIEEMALHYHKLPNVASDATENQELAYNWGNEVVRYQTIAKSTLPAGGDQPHNNLQPYVVSNYIVKAKQSIGVVGKVLGEKSDSTKDTYSCDYINNTLKLEDFSSKITLDSGYTKTISFAKKTNNLYYINMTIDFQPTTVVNQQIGTHSLSLNSDCTIPLFCYGDSYTGGFGEISFNKNGTIRLVAYSSGQIKQVICNGILF